MNVAFSVPNKLDTNILRVHVFSFTFRTQRALVVLAPFVLIKMSHKYEVVSEVS